MIVKLLKLIQFRNYQALKFTPHERLTVLTGDNAQGKTNILESLYLCATGRSHRTSRDSQMISFDEQNAYIRTDLFRGSDRRIEVRIIKDKPKQVKLDGAPISKIGEMLGCLNAVMFSPEDMRLVKDGPQERRRFVDIELSQSRPKYFYSLTNYIQALNQRNFLLKRINMELDNASSLEVWDEQLAENGAAIAVMRREFLESLNVIAKDIHSDISGNKEDFFAHYDTDIEASDETSAKKELIKLFESNRSEDIKRGLTQKGLHRDDVQLKLNGKDMRFFVSQGQQRTAALALKLGELKLMSKMVGDKPILLLDDVMSELDEKRQTALSESTKEYQTILTCTYIPSKTDGDVYKVINGEIKKL